MSTPSLFNFINFIWPAWYFNFNPLKGQIPYWIDYYKLTPKEKLLINFDSTYSDQNISLQDAAFQAYIIGMVKVDSDLSLNKEVLNTKATIGDQYKFIRKHFNKNWIYFVFILRILYLKNPLKEIIGVIKTSRISKLTLKRIPDNQFIDFTVFDINNFNISLIIPTLERYEYLKNLLDDISTQSLKIKEIIIIDQSEHPLKDFYNEFQDLPLRIIYQKKTGQWTARNTACQEANGDYLLFLDDDSRVDKLWIENHLKAFAFFNVDISSGTSFINGREFLTKKYRNFIWSDRLDSGNVMIKKEVFNSIGLFDLQFDGQRMGDGEFGLRAYLNGFRNISNPLARRNHLLANTGGLRKMGYWTAFKPVNFFTLRPAPSVIYFFKRYFPNGNLTNYLIINLPLSYIPNNNIKNKNSLLWGLFISCVTLPLTIINLKKSFNRSSKMINKGPIIDKISEL